MSEEKKSRNRRPGGITRREFVVAGAGALAATGIGLSCRPQATSPPDIASAHGPDLARNTRAVLEAMGGIGAFVGAGQVVNILPNAQGNHPGTSTDPVLVKTVVDMCKEAGASQVRWLTWISGRYWERSRIAELMKGTGAELVQVDADDPEQWEELAVPGGKALETIRIFRVLRECDVFISMPIFKDHIGSRFTGALKNYMGTSHPVDNRKFHPTFEGEDLVHMERSIADMNVVVRPPDLIVADAMTVLTSNGPFGPGNVAEPQRVVAAVDRVACDAYGATLLGLQGPGITMIREAYEHGLGEIDLGRVNVREMEIA